MRFSAAFKYVVNRALRTWEQEGLRSASLATARLIFDEAIKVPRLLRLRWGSDVSFGDGSQVNLMSSDVVRNSLDVLEHLRIEVRTVSLDPDDLDRHTKAYSYPRFYAGGPVAKGGARERKILEYFACLSVLPIVPDDVVIDVASEHSVFPDVVRKLTGASVFRQDLIYRPGIDEDRIGGSATDMPVGPQFASKLTLHNSFEHFEDDADTEFVREAWRVLRPGGGVCIVPLFLADSHRILTDPLVDRRNIKWDLQASVVSVVGYRNRFGRFYSPNTFQTRIVEPAMRCGFRPIVYHFDNTHLFGATSGLHFGLVLEKQQEPPARGAASGPIVEKAIGDG